MTACIKGFLSPFALLFLKNNASFKLFCFLKISKHILEKNKTLKKL